MPETRRRQARIDELLRQAHAPNPSLISHHVVREAERGLLDPSQLTALEIKRICYAVIAYHAGRRPRPSL